MTPEEIIERISGIMAAHYPDGATCRCGQAVADEAAWATHAAEELDADARRWANEMGMPT